MRIEGWRIAGFVSVGLAVMAITIAAFHGFSEDAIRTFVRSTARTSLVLFLLAFSASSLQALFRRSWSAWLLRNRRYLGVSFAFSHASHLLALIVLAITFPHPFLDRLGWPTLLGGGLAYLFILAMTITSFAAPRKFLGQNRWKFLHTFGSYYVWIIFAQSYVPRALKDPFYMPFAVALFVVLGLRLARSLKNRDIIFRARRETT